jgi:hypothetical protein
MSGLREGSLRQSSMKKKKEGVDLPGIGGYENLSVRVVIVSL